MRGPGATASKTYPTPARRTCHCAPPGTPPPRAERTLSGPRPPQPAPRSPPGPSPAPPAPRSTSPSAAKAPTQQQADADGRGGQQEKTSEIPDDDIYERAKKKRARTGENGRQQMTLRVSRRGDTSGVCLSSLTAVLSASLTPVASRWYTNVPLKGTPLRYTRSRREKENCPYLLRVTDGGGESEEVAVHRADQPLQGVSLLAVQGVHLCMNVS